MSKVVRAFLLALAGVLLTATPALAYLYRAPIAITENASTSYAILPVMWDSANSWMASNGFMNSTANDTRVQTLGGLNKPWMVADNKTLTAIPVPADSQTNLYFVTGEGEASAMDIIVGYDGYFTITDDPALELGDNFSVNMSGWFNTAGGAGKRVATKLGATAVWASSPTSGNITAVIPSNVNFPIIEATASSNNTAGGTTHTVDLPDDIATNDLLLVFFSSDGNPTITFPSDWTQLYQTANAAQVKAGAWYKFSDGSDDATVSVTTSASERTTHISYRISGCFFPPEVGTAATGTSVNPDPPSLAPSWGNGKTLWIANAAWDRNLTVSSYPTGFSDGIYKKTEDYDNGCGVATATSNNETATNDPGTYTVSDNEAWVANTVAVRGVISVTATGVASADCIVDVWADGTDFGIDVDGSTENSTALSGTSVPDVASSWIVSSNATPYFNYFSVSIGGVETARYEPTSMILVTTLPDVVGAYDADITWGSNPAGVGATIGSMVSSGQSSIGAAADTSTSDLLPVVGGTDWRPDAGVSATLQANPMRPLVTAVSDNTTLSEYQVWVWLGIVFVVFITVLVGANVRGHHLITGIAASAAIVLLVVWTVFPIFALVVVALAIWGGLVSERSPSL